MPPEGKSAHLESFSGKGLFSILGSAGLTMQASPCSRANKKAQPQGPGALYEIFNSHSGFDPTLVGELVTAGSSEEFMDRPQQSASNLGMETLI